MDTLKPTTVPLVLPLGRADDPLQTELDTIMVWATMLYPTDSEARTTYMNVLSAQLQANVSEAQGQATVSLSLDLLRCVIHAPSWPTLHQQSAQIIVAGCHAGEILLHVLWMQHSGESEPSLRKALWLLEQRNRDDNRDGARLPATKLSLRQHWEAYRSVAHLWAAYTVLLGRYGLNDREDDDRIYGTDSFAQHRLGDTLPRFFYLSEVFRAFGETFLPLRSKAGPLLPPGGTWRPPPTYPLGVWAEDEQYLDINPDYQAWLPACLHRYPDRSSNW